MPSILYDLKNNFEDERKISKRILNSYPEAIVVDDDGNLNFEDSCYNLATCIFERGTVNMQQTVFGKLFENRHDIYEFLMTYMRSLRELMEEKLNNYNIEEDDAI